MQRATRWLYGHFPPLSLSLSLCISQQHSTSPVPFSTPTSSFPRNRRSLHDVTCTAVYQTGSRRCTHHTKKWWRGERTNERADLVLFSSLLLLLMSKLSAPSWTDLELWNENGTGICFFCKIKRLMSFGIKGEVIVEGERNGTTKETLEFSSR